MSPSKKIVICLAGMHRSGTSLMASYLEKCGISMGHRLVKASTGNEKGHFEDRDLVDFHKAVLKDGNDSILKTHSSDTFNPNIKVRLTDEQRQQAKKIVDSRMAQNFSWGFKDPRSALFLDVWDDLLPDAKYIFVYRHPELVIDSLYRRKGAWVLYLFFWWAGGAWIRYNQEIFDFYLKNKEKSILINIGGFNKSYDNAINVLANKLDTELPCSYKEVYSPKDIAAQGVETGAFTKLNLLFLGDRLEKLYRNLERHAMVNEAGVVQIS